MMGTKQTVKIIQLTPESARRLLADNSHNRPLRQRRITQLTRIIKEGRWRFNGASVVVERNGRLADGQHRCHAVIRANKAVRTVLVTGISATAFDTIDQGAKRSGADIFSLCGVSNAAIVSSSMTIIYQDKKGITLGTEGGGSAPDMDERIAIFDSLSGYEDIVREVCHQRDALKGVFPQPKMAGLYYLFQKRHKIAARCFLSAFVSKDSDPQNPAMAVRNELIRITEGGYKLSGQSQCAYMKVAWNKFVAGKKVSGIELPPMLDIDIDSLTSNYWLEHF